MTGLGRCAGDVAAFLDHHWGRAPLHRAGADPGAFADLFSLDDVDRFVTESAPRSPSFRLVRDGRPLDASRYTRTARIGGQVVPGVGDPVAVMRELAGGATIVLQGLQRSCPPLARLARDLELELSHPVQVNAYVTPAGSRGLGVHYDTHDVFVLQLAGSKQWSVHPPVLEDPLASQPWKGGRADPGEACLSVDLHAGDVLYVPRGFLHSAQAQQALSAHLTVGVVTTTWHDVVTRLVSAAATERELRRALPAGYADDADGLATGVGDALVRLRAWLDGVDPRVVADDTIRRFWAGRGPQVPGQLGQVLALGALDDATVLARRRGSVCHLVRRPDRLEVVLAGRSLAMPPALSDAMARIAGSGPFPLGDLADLLDGPSRAVLARRLVLEGLLEVVGSG